MNIIISDRSALGLVYRHSQVVRCNQNMHLSLKDTYVVVSIFENSQLKKTVCENHLDLSLFKNVSHLDLSFDFVQELIFFEKISLRANYLYATYPQAKCIFTQLNFEKLNLS